MRLLAASLFLALLGPATGEEDVGVGSVEGSAAALVVPVVLSAEEAAFDPVDGIMILPVPEPSRLVLLVIGILAFGLTFRCGLSRAKRRG
jgi:hypothetical protein